MSTMMRLALVLAALAAALAAARVLVVVRDMAGRHAWRADRTDPDDDRLDPDVDEARQQQWRATLAAAAAAAAAHNNGTHPTAPPPEPNSGNTPRGGSPTTFFSFPKTNRTDPNDDDQLTLCDSWRSTTTVAPRMLLGGGKAGSTGLYYMLYQGNLAVPAGSGLGWNASHLVANPRKGKGKELCFGKPGKGRSRKDWESLFEPRYPSQTIGLDFCPQGTEKSRVCALWSLFPCEVKFVMLVRDPADRARSWFNDKGSSNQSDKRNADSFAMRMVGNRNFQLSDILRDALFGCGVDPRAILVVDADGLTGSPETAQVVMDAVHDHYGLPRMVHRQIRNNRGDMNDDRHPFNAELKPETALEIRSRLQSQTRGFLDLLEHPGGILQKSLLPPETTSGDDDDNDDDDEPREKSDASVSG